MSSGDAPLLLLVRELPVFWLVFGRVSAIFLIAPVFGHRSLPVHGKLGLAFFISLFLLPLQLSRGLRPPLEWLDFTLALAGEVLLGLAIGYLAYLLFAAIQIGGQILDLEMGFSIVNVVDPVFGEASPIVGEWLTLLAVLLYLAVDGHHVLIEALAQSFAAAPPGAAGFGAASYEVVVREFGWMFLTAVKIVAPVWAVLFVSTVVLGVLARAMPQMNVFLVGLPAKILVGVAGLVVATPLLVLTVRQLLPHSYASLAALLQAAGGASPGLLP